MLAGSYQGSNQSRALYCSESRTAGQADTRPLQLTSAGTWGWAPDYQLFSREMDARTTSRSGKSCRLGSKNTYIQPLTACRSWPLSADVPSGRLPFLPPARKLPPNALASNAAATSMSSPPLSSRELVDRLDARHDELIARLDELNAQIEAALAEFGHARETTAASPNSLKPRRAA
jgi:hypothetical protein